MPHPITTTVTLGAASATSIAGAQTLPGLGGPLNLNGSATSGGVATLDAPRRVIIHSTGDSSAITFTVSGTGGPWLAAQVLRETIAGTNGGDSITTQDFQTVTSITGTGSTNGAVTVGTNGIGAGPWVVWDAFQKPFNVSLFGAVMAGAPTWGVEYTYDDVFGLWLPPGVLFPRPLPFALMNGLVGSADGQFNSHVFASRLTLTAPGSVMLTQQQQGAS